MFEKHVGSVRQWQLFIWIISCTGTSISFRLTKGKRLTTSGNPQSYSTCFSLALLQTIHPWSTTEWPILPSINQRQPPPDLPVYLCTCSSTFLALTAPLSLLYCIPPIYSLLMIYKPSSCCSFSLPLSITAFDLQALFFKLLILSPTINHCF